MTYHRHGVINDTLFMGQVKHFGENTSSVRGALDDLISFEFIII